MYEVARNVLNVFRWKCRLFDNLLRVYLFVADSHHVPDAKSKRRVEHVSKQSDGHSQYWAAYQVNDCKLNCGADDAATFPSLPPTAPFANALCDDDCRRDRRRNDQSCTNVRRGRQAPAVYP